MTVNFFKIPQCIFSRKLPWDVLTLLSFQNCRTEVVTKITKSSRRLNSLSAALLCEGMYGDRYQDFLITLSIMVNADEAHCIVIYQVWKIIKSVNVAVLLKIKVTNLSLNCTVTLEVLEQSLIGIHPQIPYKSLLLFLSRITTLLNKGSFKTHLSNCFVFDIDLALLCVLNKVNSQQQMTPTEFDFLRAADDAFFWCVHTKMRVVKMQ